MSEDDLPYQIKITGTGELKTIGRYNFDNQLSSDSTMIAHPKVDPVTGVLFTLSYNAIHKPYLKCFKFSPNGTKSPHVKIQLNQPTMMHDFAITENYVIIPDQQLVFNISEMMAGGSPLIFDKKKVPRFGVLNKIAKNDEEIKWLEVPNSFCFHLWNSWEDRDTGEIIVVGSCMSPAESIFHECDEGMVNQKYLGRKTKYAYLAIAEPWPKVSGFAKVDLSNGEVKKYFYGDEMYGAFVHNERNLESELPIVNAVSLKVKAVIKLPSRVPCGFHGLGGAGLVLVQGGAKVD
ncbi:hypothetical protein LguiA_035386 [Lonicera macranthoides]